MGLHRVVYDCPLGNFVSFRISYVVYEYTYISQGNCFFLLLFSVSACGHKQALQISKNPRYENPNHTRPVIFCFVFEFSGAEPRT